MVCVNISYGKRYVFSIQLKGKILFVDDRENEKTSPFMLFIVSRLSLCFEEIF